MVKKTVPTTDDDAKHILKSPQADVLKSPTPRSGRKYSPAADVKDNSVQPVPSTEENSEEAAAARLKKSEAGKRLAAARQEKRKLKAQQLQKQVQRLRSGK